MDQFSKYDIPLSHLDYHYIESCENDKELEKIIKVLRSGKEGRYPQLEDCAEKKLQKINPKSKVLWKETPVCRGADLPADEWDSIADDLQNWERDMSSKDQMTKPKSTQNSECRNLPPVRGLSHSIPTEQDSSVQSGKKDSKRATPRDYKEWDKVDIDAELAKVDGKEVKSKTSQAMPSSPIPEKVNTAALSDDEKNVKAEREKDKGNEAFRAADYDEAILYYTRSLSISQSVAALNNRAQSYIKLEKWKKAVNDCNAVLHMESSNLKALLRRGVALKGQKNFVKAKEDFVRVTAHEPNNKRAQVLLEEVTELLQEQKKTGRRMVIKEVDGSDEEDLSAHSNSNEDCRSPKGQVNGHIGGALIEEMVGGDPTETLTKIVASETSPNTCNETQDNSDSPPVTLINNPNRPTGTSSSEAATANVKVGSPKSTTVPHTPLKTGETKLASPNKSSKSSPNKAAHSKGADRSIVNTQKKNDCPPEITAPILPPVPPPALPPAALALKDQGNQYFKMGQYGNAIGTYDKAAEMIINDASQGPNLSVLLSNRAACKHKIGDCRGCIHDCTAALQLTPQASKALLRRGVAYEALEKFGEAYVDYRQVLTLDNNAHLAQEGSNRCGQQLQKEKGTKWREMLPQPVPHTRPILPQSAPSQPTPSIPMQTKPPSTVPQKGASAEQMFEKYKKLGNDLVQKGRHVEAIKCYTQCIEHCPRQVAPYTNRALCHLKLDQPERVVEDCGVALTLDPGNVKALYRRAMAYKQTKSYAAAVADLNQLLLVDPKNASAKKDLYTINDLLQNEIKTSKTRQRMNIEEVDSSSEEENENPLPDSRPILSPAKSSLPSNPKPSTQNISSKISASQNLSSQTVKVPTPSQLQKATPYEFIHSWTSLKGASGVEPYVSLLHQVKPADIPKVFSNKLDGDMLQKIFQCISYIAQNGDSIKACAYLRHLPKVKRFSTVAMFLTPHDLQAVSSLLQQLEGIDGGLTSDDCKQLKSQFGMS